MSVDDLRQRVAALAGKRGTPALLCVTGASGAGKTATLEALRKKIETRLLPTLGFDSLGVPSEEEMLEAWESPRGWQKAMTWHWVQTAKNVFRTHPLVMLEGSFDPQYAIAACTANRMRFAVALLHDDQASDWSRYLHEQVEVLGGHIIDASAPVATVVDGLCAHALTLLTDVPAVEVPKPRRN